MNNKLPNIIGYGKSILMEHITMEPRPTTLSIDIETYSSTDLIKSGVYKYAEDPDFTILLFAYAFDNDPVQIVDLASGETLPDEVFEALTDNRILKTAHNANFERTCIAQHFMLDLNYEDWECTMVKSAMVGLPFSLDAVSKALKLEQGKDAAGKALIKYFCVPCKPTKVNGGRTRNLPRHDPERWENFKNYCIQDVVVERGIRDMIKWFEIPDAEKQLWQLDQKINDTGVMIDPVMVINAIKLDKVNAKRLNSEAVDLTGLSNPNSAAQLKSWLSAEMGEEVTALTKTDIPVLIESADSDQVKQVLQIRQEMAKTSVKKYIAMVSACGSDNRVRGLFQYYGANRTGRWAGRLVQVQNLPQNHLDDLDLARRLVRNGDLELLSLLFGNVPDTLSQLIRTSFVAPKGHRFIVADFSAIEARVIAWLAGEKWRMDVFNTHGKIYEASAAQMFRVPIETVTKGSDLRQKGKVAELALGYQGGPGALVSMGALNMGLDEEELPKLVAMWRQANQNIVALWYDVEEAAKRTIYQGEHMRLNHGLVFTREGGVLFIRLPSGRRLSYIRPNLEPNKFGKESITYEGMNQTSKAWGKQETYGGKLVENITQAVARDCLADAMLRLDKRGYKIVLHVHDEVVLEMPYGKGSLEEAIEIMRTPIPWAKGLPLNADGFETEYYKK